jgi:hypothetical protein
MATIPEQLAAMSVTDSLKHASIPAQMTKMPWATVNDGSWSETTGWSPTTYTETAEPSVRSGAYYNVAQITGGFAGVGITKTTGALNNADRRTGIWLFSEMGAKVSGYQLQWITVSSTTVLKFVLTRWFEGGGTVLMETEPTFVSLENFSFYLTNMNGSLQAWRREGEGTIVQMGSTASDSTFKEGYVGMGGNGSNPNMVNLVSGKLTAEQSATGRRKLLMGVG